MSVVAGYVVRVEHVDAGRPTGQWRGVMTSRLTRHTGPFLDLCHWQEHFQ
jgi:hypothetical protein